MSASSNNQGRAYEYAWLDVLSKKLSKSQQIELVRNSSFDANMRAWLTMPEEMRDLLYISADAAVETLVELEPRLNENNSGIIRLEFQQDKTAIKGDVRDILIKRPDTAWEIGLSIKHNHDAVKHSRLSYCLDFADEWFGNPCSDAYWADIQPIFDRLKEHKAQGSLWSDISDKENEIYVPLLRAFMEEIRRAYTCDPSVPKKMVEYLIGFEDYYKIVSQDNKRVTIIHAFNMHGTLNLPGKITVSAICVPVVDYPTEIIALRFKDKSSNTVEMYLNNGWQLSFRIHNASSKVEPSLKFDIRFIGMPVEILNLECRWKS